ncbi:Athe_2463 domain-containing protein [Paenibacillus sp. LHD-38]|uniref:Athe_2463 domain-containing protein n=1 Tax=Paenibacillus sp. LHD-38 TaxID=3072143 RepID=UPI00280D878B|nr:CARDB domain-containing protein [Paenibacillus sp. LHD-38]MDQ8732970.1 CARDB domain-containing protein [Paenibacillus sp. LHD-38]
MAVVYGSPASVADNQFDQGQWRYLGYDINGTVYRNWLFRSDSRATLNVTKNWVKEPWKTSTGISKRIQATPELTANPDAVKWLEAIVDPYKETPTFIQSYNKRTGKGWTGDTLIDYVIIQQIPTDFSPGIVQMWNIWQPDGSWWYEMFYIPPLNKLEIKTQPDLIISAIANPPDAWLSESVPIKITTKNQGKTDSGPFTVGIVGTTTKSEVISNIPPGQIKTVTVHVSSNVSGIKSFTAKTDFGEAVTESNENNNTKDFKIAFNKKNEPTIPIAVISHNEGDHRTTPEMTIKPAAEPKLDDKLSYSPGKETITIREWKYKTPTGTTIFTKPFAKDFTIEGTYLVELRVTNSAKKVSEWAQLTIRVGEPTPPSPTLPPRPELKAGLRFVPDIIFAGETSSLLNSSYGFDSYEWKFSTNLDPIFPDKSKYEYINQTFTQAGTYRATIKVSDSSGSSSAEAALTVIDPKPIAIVAGATKIIEGRAFPFPYHLNNSYTPLAERDVTIDHSRSEKRYKRVGDVGYTIDFPTTNNLAVGQYSLEGKVYDTTGRVSEWADLVVEVVPDLPPAIEVTAPEETYRSSSFMLYMEAESSDADILEHLFIEERYDQDDDGNFEEEAWTTLYDGAFKTTHSLSYTTVGKRQYRAAVTEDYGKSAASSLAMTDVRNYAPSVNFNVFGVTQQPEQGEESGPPVINYTAQSIFRSWSSKKPYVGGGADKLAWKADAAAISTKNGQMVNFNLKYPNAGSGLNSRNKYALASDLQSKTRWQVQPVGSNGYYDQDYGLASNSIFNPNRLYTYHKTKRVNAEGTAYENVFSYTERDAVTGAVRRPSFNLEDSLSGELMPDEKFYSKEVINKNSIRITVHDNHGKKVDVFSFGLVGVDSRNFTYSLFEMTPDLKYLVIGMTHFGAFNDDTYYYKYSLENRRLEWAAAGSSVSRYEANGNYTFFNKMSVDPSGTIYISGKVITKITPNGSRVDSQVVSGTGDGSTVSVSDDGKYLYRLNFGSQSGDSHDMYLTTYNAVDLSIVSTYKNFLMRSIYTSVAPYSYNPIVREDGTVVISDYNKVYFFSQTGAFLFSSDIPNSPFLEFYQAGLLPNGDLFSPYFDRMTFRYGIYNITSRTSMVQEGANGNQYYGTSGAIGTPILPNGSIFFIEKTSPISVLPFVSASGNANLQDVDANTVGIFDDNWGGLLYDSGSVMKNYALEFSVSVNDIKNYKPIGAGFHIQNEKNMYAVEWSKDKITLYKAVNGLKTTLQSASLARSPFTAYPFKVEVVNGTLRVFVNYAKVIEITDGTFTKGAAGLMSLGQSSASFSNVKKTNFGDTYTQETYDTVLVNDPISYEKLFNDIEKDPMTVEEWSYSHNPNFFENPEGLSVHSGQTYGTTINALAKAGVYEISFRANDNPGLAAYGKWSEPVKKLLYVHRRPVAKPEVRFTGKVYAEGESLDYETLDASYDPDIAHILSDKLFRTRWADESSWKTGKREYYNRPGVELIVQEQVRDLHGAWSYWGQYIVYKDALSTVNQTKPVMTITYPSGSTAAAPTVLVKEPVIKWTYADADNDRQEQYRLSLTYADHNETALFIEHEGSALSYPVLEGTIEPGRVVRVQGQVYSSGVWSNLSNSKYFVLDLPPQTFLLSFNGPDADHPIYTNSNRPQLRTFTVDPEIHPITSIDYEVYRAANGTKVVDTESSIMAASYTPAALAEGLHYWKARANDSYIWGPYSSNGFFFVDTVKPADVNEQLEVEPTAVSVTFNAFSDAEPSSGHASRAFYLQKVNANGSVTNIDLNGDGQSEYSMPLALERQSIRVTGLDAGQEYRLTVIDADLAGNEGIFAYIHFVTNRSPAGDFDWSPKPVYVGDMASFMSDVNDPDSNTLSILYELTSPLGAKSSYSYTVNGPAYPARGPSLRLTDDGTWTMKMTVSDGIADPVSVTKSLQVLPLQLFGFVKHTELWEQHRKAFNVKASGKEDAPRGFAVFWAGEKFVLEADTTMTGTATRADRVEVRMGSYEASLKPIGLAQNKWKGELWEEEFAKLLNGTISFIFTAYYNNGTVITTQVDVWIDGQTLQIVSVHRIQ